MRVENRIDRIIVQKVLDYCNKTKKFVDRFGNTFEDYCKDEAFQFSCSTCIIQIGELTTRLSDDFKAQHSEIPWHKIKGLRNLHVHEYEKVKPDKMWEIITGDIPALKNWLEQILAKE